MFTHAANNPYQRSELDRSLARESICYERGGESTEERTARHGTCDGALTGVALDLEVIRVCIGPQHATHRRYIKAEEPATCTRRSANRRGAERYSNLVGSAGSLPIAAKPQMI